MRKMLCTTVCCCLISHLTNNLSDGTAGILRAVDEDCTQIGGLNWQERSSTACRQGKSANQWLLLYTRWENIEHL